MEKEEEIWKTVFKLNKIDVEKLAAFLKEKLVAPHTFETHEDSVILSSPSRDSAYRVGVWISHNALGRSLPYGVSGWRNQKLIHSSSCKKCREGDLHTNHRRSD